MMKNDHSLVKLTVAKTNKLNENIMQNLFKLTGDR